MSIKNQIESLLFISVKPLTLAELAKRTSGKKDDIKKAIEELKEKYNIEESGISIQVLGEKVQMVTNPENSEIVSEFLKDETTGELTPASLETLTVIGYRGPVTKSEIELIRGVNCSMILRNLLMRGLIEEKKGKDELLSTYQVTFDFMKYLGINDISELPNYKELNDNEDLAKLLNPEEFQNKEKENIEDSSKIIDNEE